MKTKLILSALLGSALPLLAVLRPDSIPQEVPAPPEGAAEPGAQAPELGDPKPRAIGFLGVSAQAIPLAQAQLLKVKKGVSLLTVMAGSPAAKAGLRVGDVVTQVGDEKVGTMLELSDAIQAHREGDRIKLKVVQNGKEVEKKVILAGRKAPVAGAMLGGFGARILPGARMGGGLRLNFGGAGIGGGFRMGDAEGSVEIKGRGEEREVIVRDHDNEIVFEGPWVSPQDKASAPPHIKRRIDRMSGIFGDDQFMWRNVPAPRVAPVLPAVEDLGPPLLEKKAPDNVAPRKDDSKEDGDK